MECSLCHVQHGDIINRAGPPVCAECYHTEEGLMSRVKWLEDQLPELDRLGHRGTTNKLIHGLKTMKHYKDIRSASKAKSKM
ncbi:MAG: hypothetical protein ACTSX8_04630 [Alphaproteobacteria bacterium]